MYTITWRESKYTLFRLSHASRKRSTSLQKIMLHMNADHGIKGTEIVGYDMISSNCKDSACIQDHPAFRRIVQLINTKRDEVRTWMETESIETNKSGLLWDLLEPKNPTTMTKRQLEDRINEWAPLIKEYESLKPAHDSLASVYLVQSHELAKAREDLKKEKQQCDAFFQQLCEKIDECGDLKKRLVQLGHSISP